VVSVVVPVYRSAETLRELHARVVDALAEIGEPFELVLVEDGGEDGSWEILAALARSDPRVRAVRLSRNFGQHAAITAGLELARGRWIVVMDCDLQDPPEEIGRLYAKALEGYDVVFAKRKQRGGSRLRRLGSRAYFRLLRAFTGTEADAEYGTFSIVSRPVRDAFLRLTDRNRHYLFILYWLGFRQTAVEFDYGERAAGKSSYTLRALVAHAFAGLFFQTTVLLRWVIYLGFLLAFAGVAAAAYFGIARVTATAYPGWTSLIVLILLVGGFIIISTGVTGLYIGQVFEEVRRRPLYVIAEEAGSTKQVPVARKTASEEASVRR
jgi:polyisoprenyl-phosphate glycosyltransferase